MKSEEELEREKPEPEIAAEEEVTAKAIFENYKIFVFLWVNGFFFFSFSEFSVCERDGCWRDK